MKNLITIVLVFSLLLVFVNFLFLSIDLLRYKWDIDFSESFFLFPFFNLHINGSFYSDEAENSINIVKYPPLYYLFTFPFVEVFGYKLLSLRLASLFYFLIFFLLLYKIIKQILSSSKKSIIPLLFSLFFVVFPTVFWLSFQGRLEWLSMIFVAITTILIIEYIKRRKNLLNLISLFSVFAILTKQTFISVQTSFFIFLLLSGNVNDLKKYFIKTFLYSIAALVFVIIVFPGFIRNMLLSTGVYSPTKDAIKMIALQSLPIIIALSFSLRKKLVNDNMIKFFLIFSLTSFLLSMIFNFRSGGWIYYSIEFVFSSTILLSLLYFYSTSNKRVLIIIVMLFSILYFSIFDPRISFYVFKRYSFPPLVNTKTDNIIQSIVNRFGDKCITENPSYLVNIGIMPPESWLAYELYKNGKVDKSDIYSAFFKGKQCIVYYDRFNLLPGFEKISSGYILYKKLKWVDLAFHERDVFILIKKS